MALQTSVAAMITSVVPIHDNGTAASDAPHTHEYYALGGDGSLYVRVCNERRRHAWRAR